MTAKRWRRVEEIYHAALECAEAVRSTYLDSACAEDSELRQEVESLLARASQAESFLESHSSQTTVTMMLNEQIGPYRILGPLGAGGMGEVYRAHDSKLGRDVALKTLPKEFALDGERLARFLREARTLASLNHPNIAAIYGLEEYEAAIYLVLELVEGENLRGPLPVNQALEYTRQVAEGLEAAHEKGIIHRDLKPANLKVTPKGRVKILDFGLAKAVWGTGVQDLSQVAAGGTATQLQTALGQLVGTPAYMSPEQARGSQVDERADIWAFGCLVYELLTGKRAFAGETLHDTIAAVLERQPDWSALPAKTPAKIRDLIRACLETDPARRLSSLAEARRVIEAVLTPSRRVNRWHLVTAVALAMLLAGLALWMPSRFHTTDRSEWIPITKLPDSAGQPALSADGRMVAFVRGPDTFFTPGQIYVKMLPDGEPVQLTNDTSLKMSPAFSPDGSEIAYTVMNPPNWDTWVTLVLGGQSHPWLANTSGLVWAAKRRMLFSEIKKDMHMGIVAAGPSRAGARDVYLPAGDRGMAHRSYPSPDGKWALVVEMDRGRWLPCRLVPMDGSSAGRAVGPPEARCTFAAWSPDGKWMYFSSAAGGTFHTWRQRFPGGRPEQLTSGPNEEEGIAVAPDGRSFITSVAIEQSAVWLHDSRGDRQISLEGYSFDPKFTPDGKGLCYRVSKGALAGFDAGELWLADVDSGRREALLPELAIVGEPGVAYDISADGRQFVLAARDSKGTYRLWVAEFDHRSPPRQIPNVEGDQPFFGPEGEIIFRAVEASGAFAYRVGQEGSGLRKIVETPIASLYGISSDRQWLAVKRPGDTGSTSAAFSVSSGALVTILSPALGFNNSRVEWSTDGRHFVIHVQISGSGRASGRTYVIPLSPGKTFPQIPAGGFRSEEEIRSLPGARTIDSFDVAPGAAPEVYAVSRQIIQRNLYRISLP
jgi:serine/threonine protein kinase/Tol biopolymer transport system component